MIRAWRYLRARLEGRKDGKNLNPAPGQATCSQAIMVIRDEGQTVVNRLKEGFVRRDKALEKRYLRAAHLHGTATDQVEAAELVLAEAQAEYARYPALRNQKARDRAATRLHWRARRTVRTRLALDVAIANRESDWKSHCARCETEATLTDKCLSIYVKANLGERNDHPDGLSGQAWPRLRLPQRDGDLEWNPSREDARAGRVRRSRGPGRGLPAGPGLST